MESLIDRIYECSFVPEYWPGVLDELAKIADARGGVMFAANLTNRNILNWTASQNIHDIVGTFVNSGIFSKTQRLSRFLAQRHGGFITEDQVYLSRVDMETDPIYRDVLWPAGLGWCAGTSVALPTNDMLVLTVERDYDRGTPGADIIQRLTTLRPHLARSALMSARLQLERAQAATQTLAMIGLPGLVFDDCGKVLAANSLIEALPEFIYWRAQNLVSLKDPKANTLLQQAVETLGYDEAAPARSFGVRGPDAAAAAMVAHVIPVRRSARDIFVHSAGVLVLTPVALPQAPPVELVQSLFDLTPAEARVARDLATGQSVEQIATKGGVLLSTVRTQMRGVLEKTGCRRQAEAIALLGGINIKRN